MSNFTDYEIQQLAENVRIQMEMDAKYASEREQEYQGKQQRRLREIIVEVVRRYYGRVIEEIVAQIQSFFP